MSEPFLGQIYMFGFNFPPRGYAQCDGQILPINQNQSLYSLLGTNFGGDGRSTFGLPDLRGRVGVHASGNPGQKGGAETITLTATQVPAHSHAAQANSADASQASPVGNVLAKVPSKSVYSDPNSLVSQHPGDVANAGGGQSHNNMQPYQTINFCIALQGLFPSRN